MTLPTSAVTVERVPLVLRAVVLGFVCVMTSELWARWSGSTDDLLGVIASMAMVFTALTLRLTTVIDPVRRVVRKAWGFVVPFVVSVEEPFSGVGVVELCYECDAGPKGGSHGYSASVLAGATGFPLADRISYDRARAIAARTAEAVGCDLRERSGSGRDERFPRPATPLRERLLAAGVGDRRDEELGGAIERVDDGEDVLLTIHQNKSPRTAEYAVLSLFVLAAALAAYPLRQGAGVVALLFTAGLGSLLWLTFGSVLGLSIGRWELRAGPWGIRITRRWIISRAWEIPAADIEAVFVSTDERQLRNFPALGVRVVGAGRSFVVGTGLDPEHLGVLERCLKAALVSDVWRPRATPEGRTTSAA